MLTAISDPNTSALTIKFTTDLLSTNIEQVGRALEKTSVSATDYKILTLDLLSCKMVDSVGLNLVFSVLNHAKERGCRTNVLVPRGGLERIVQIAQLGKLFNVEVR